MTDDPSEDVRAAAVDRIAESDSASTVMLLLAALKDPSSKVVIQALDGLEFEADETVIPQIEPIARNHPDPEVREKAEESISFLD